MTIAFGSGRVTLGATEIGASSGISLELNDQLLSVADDGNIHISKNVIVRNAPRISFATGALGGLFGLLAGNLPVFSGASRFISARGDGSGPGYAAGTVHLQAAFASSTCVLDSLSWSRGAAASASVSCYALSADGTTDPLALSTVAAPAQLNTQPVFVLDSLTVNGVACPCVSLNLTVDHRTTNADDRCYDQGKPFPRICVAAGVLGASVVSATIETSDLSTAFAAGDIVAVFREKAANGTGYAAATVTLTINAAIVRATGISASGPASRTLSVTAAHDGSAPLTVGVA